MNINNNNDKNKIGIKTPNETILRTVKRQIVTVHTTVNKTSTIPRHQKILIQMQQNQKKKSLTNNNNKEILPKIPTAKEIPNNDSRYSNHPSNKTRKSKIGKNEIKENSRTANKKSNKTAYTHRTVPDNEILISGVAPPRRTDPKN